MKFLQKLGKALMLPVAVLPICGILMGIGYLLCPATMQGGDIQGAANLIGLFLVKAGGALIDNMAILFAIGVGVGMSDKNDGTGGIAALASWLMLTTLLSTGFVTTLMPSIAESEVKTIAFNKIANPFIGILAGVIGSTCYNKFKGTKLPDWLAFFSGKRCVAIVAGVVSIIVSAVLLFVWPLFFGLLVSIGDAIAKMGVVGAGIYAFLNRLLIPTGLHHALNNVFWFDTIGLGDLSHFWAGETSADVSWSLGMYMSGFFPCMMFGIPGAALAMVQCAKPEKKVATIGILLSAAVCSFICGVTEPFEFAFMFLAPVSGRITMGSPAIPLASVLGSIAVSVDGCIAASLDGSVAAVPVSTVAEVSGAGVSRFSAIPLTSRVLITPLMTLSAFATLMPFSRDSPFSSRLKVRPASA